MSFDPFVSSSILSSMSQRSHSTGLLYLGSLPLDTLLCFSATVRGIVFLISLFGSSLLVHKNTRDFCKLILYPHKFPKFTTSSDTFLVGSLIFF